MRTMSWVALGIAALAGLTAARWALRRRDALGRARPFPFVLVILLLMIAAGAAAPDALRLLTERRLGRIASQLAGRPVEVRCQSIGGAVLDIGVELGYVRFGPDGVPEPEALIKRDQCADLAAYARTGRDRPSREQVIAVHVLSHEAMHMSGIAGEVAAECAAVQRDAAAARLLGATAEQAKALAREYWTKVYPAMPPGYRSARCAAGHSMDERLPDAPWR
jgi:hypothetical protein